MTLPAISPDSLRLPNISLQKTTEGVKAPPSLPFTLGEELNAVVVGHTSDRAVHLQIKNKTIAADSQIPLQIGEKLTVRVDQLIPSVVLRMIGRAEDDTLVTNGFIKYYRSNPQALKDLVGLAKDYLSGDAFKELPDSISPKHINNILKLLEKIIITRDNVKNPSFVKESVAALGLTYERGLLKTLSAPVLANAESSSPTLKEVLLRVSSNLKAAELTGNLEKTGGQHQIDQLSNFVDRALQVIESLQIVNVLAQEQDQLFAFQIPFQFPGGIRMQDLYIEQGQGEKGEHQAKRFRVVLFVDMDALGELAVDAGAHEGKLRCTIKCQNKEVHDFITAFLPELQDKLSAVGYTESVVNCHISRDLSSWKQEFSENYKLFSQSSIDLSA